MADMLWTAWRRRREYRVAQVAVYSGPAFVWAEAVCAVLRRLGKPYVLTLHGGNLPDFARRWPGRVRRLIESAAVVTSPSAFLSEALAPYGGPFQILLNPIELERYAYRLRERPAPVLIWLRALHRVYNPSLAVRVLARLRGAFPDARLVFVGPDKGDGSLAEVRAVAADLGVTDAVEIVGAVAKSAVPAWLDRGDIFLNTTFVDNTPVSVLEAMACGLCVVSTDVGGVPYIVRDEVDGLLVPPDDVEAMTRAVTRLLNEPELATVVSRSARARASLHDWGRIHDQWVELLDELDARVQV